METPSSNLKLSTVHIMGFPQNSTTLHASPVSDSHSQFWHSRRYPFKININRQSAGCMHLTLIARFVGPTRGPQGDNRTQVGPMLAQIILLSGLLVSYWYLNLFCCKFIYYNTNHITLEGYTILWSYCWQMGFNNSVIGFSYLQIHENYGTQ